MPIVLVMGLCNFLLYKARIGYENTYDMRESQNQSPYLVRKHIEELVQKLDLPASRRAMHDAVKVRIMHESPEKAVPISVESGPARTSRKFRNFVKNVALLAILGKVLHPRHVHGAWQVSRGKSRQKAINL